jgi:hypothetical protein
MLRAALLSLTLAAACGSSSASSDDDRCQRMVDHLIDLRVERLDAELGAQHRAILEDTVGPRVLESCASASPAYVDCVLGARDTSSIAACEGKGGQS